MSDTGVDPDQRVCPDCGSAAGSQPFCASCGKNLAHEDRLPSRAEWDASRPTPETEPVAAAIEDAAPGAASGEPVAVPEQEVVICAPSGWYDDPDDPSKARYWNGVEWQGKPNEGVPSRGSLPDPRVELLPRRSVPSEPAPTPGLSGVWRGMSAAAKRAVVVGIGVVAVVVLIAVVGGTAAGGASLSDASQCSAYLAATSSDQMAYARTRSSRASDAADVADFIDSTCGSANATNLPQTLGGIDVGSFLSEKHSEDAALASRAASLRDQIKRGVRGPLTPGEVDVCFTGAAAALYAKDHPNDPGNVPCVTRDGAHGWGAPRAGN